jgi:hypothetical protein
MDYLIYPENGQKTSNIAKNVSQKLRKLSETLKLGF